MDSAQLKKNLAKNLAHYRKLNKLTQAELAEKLNYSDKSVSKWERGDGMPDLLVVNQLCDLYGVTIDEMISQSPPLVRGPKLKQHVVWPIISVALVWLAAVVTFFVLKLSAHQFAREWLVFIYAIPVSCVALIVFMHLWWNMFLRAVSMSALIWSIALCVFLTFRLSISYFVFIIAAILQLVVALLYVLGSNPRKKRE